MVNARARRAERRAAACTSFTTPGDIIRGDDIDQEPLITRDERECPSQTGKNGKQDNPEANPNPNPTLRRCEEGNSEIHLFGIQHSSC